MLPELETERLLLREIQLEDGPALQAFQNRPEHWRQQAVEPEEYCDGALRIQRYLQHRGPDDGRRLHVYCAIEKSSGTLIGETGLTRLHPKLASLGFGVASEHAGKGFATEMASRLVAFGFDALDLHRVSAEVAVENTASIRVLQKVGMTFKGESRDCIWAQGRWWTEARYSILEGEFASPAR